MTRTELRINGVPVSYEVDGELVVGSENVALEADEDLIRHTDWAARGYGIYPFLDAALRKTLLEGVTGIVRRKVEEVTGNPAPGFTLADYHRFVPREELHHACVRQHALCRDTSELSIDIKWIEEWVSDALKIQVRAYHKVVDKRMFCIRLVRPGKPDNNPPHRDNYIERLRHSVNGYIPLAGSNELSSLPLVPGSHRWRESDIKRTKATAIVGGVSFSVPAIVSGPGDKPLEMIRPNPAPDEGMIFSPYMVHGAGTNLQEDVTRASLEMRFFKA